jgi:uncharacterized membrane protein YeaQ/YmgE (transglycosylase-associated protein family)
MLMNFILFALLLSFFIGIAILKTAVLIGMGVVVSGLVGAAADKVVPGDLPGGILGAIMAGWFGFILGHKLLGDFGPSIAGVYLLPAFVGAVVIAFVVETFASKKN